MYKYNRAMRFMKAHRGLMIYESMMPEGLVGISISVIRQLWLKGYIKRRMNREKARFEYFYDGERDKSVRRLARNKYKEKRDKDIIYITLGGKYGNTAVRRPAI